MKIKLTATVLLLLLFASCGLATEQRQERPLPERIPIYFFHDTACGSCNGTTEFYEAFDALPAEEKERYAYEIHTYNVFQSGGMESFTALADDYGLSRENLAFPLLIINSKVFSGMEQIRENLREAFLTAGEDIFDYGYVYLPADEDDRTGLFDRYTPDKTKATLAYFYRITCEECGQVTPLLDALPDKVSIDGKQTDVEVIPFNTRSGNHSQRIAALFAAYGVPAEDQMVPIVFFSDTYYAGYESIAENLERALADGEGLGFSFPGD